MAPTPDKHCIESCKLKGKNTSEMLRCCGCNKWHHYSCVGEDLSHVGSWNCARCANQSKAILSIAQELLSFKVDFGVLLKAMDGIPAKVAEMSDELKNLEKTNSSLVLQLNEQQMDNNKLRDRIAELNLGLPDA